MTVLSEVLQSREIPIERVVRSGIPAARARDLMENAEPSVEEIRKLSKGLHLPVRELMIGANFGSASAQKLRTNFGRHVSAELQLESSAGSQRCYELSDILANTSLPYFSEFPKSAVAAETLAQIFRQDILELDARTPLGEMVGVLFEQFRCLVVPMHFRSIEGLSTRHNDRAIVLLAARFTGRMRFTLVHEICHLLTDLLPGSEEVWADEDVSHERKESGTYLEESFANAFAAAALLPAQGVLEELRSWRAANNAPERGISALEIMYLARTYGTSFAVAGSRLEAMGLLEPGGTAALLSAIAKEHKSPERFATYFGLPNDKAVDWQTGARLAFGDLHSNIVVGDISLEWASQTLGLSIADAIELQNVRRHH